MVERTKTSADAADFFMSQANFDLEDSEPKKKLRRRRGGRPRSKPISLNEAEFRKPTHRVTPLDHSEIPHQHDGVEVCPGCGGDIDEGDFVETLISFATGAADYLDGDPVRTQAIHSLKQQAKALDLPEPYEDWLLEICVRLETQVHRQLDAQRDAIRISLEEELRKELVGDLYEHIRAEIEDVIRAEVERDMWELFQQNYRQRRDA